MSVFFKLAWLHDIEVVVDRTCLEYGMGFNSKMQPRALGPLKVIACGQEVLDFGHGVGVRERTRERKRESERERERERK